MGKKSTFFEGMGRMYTGCDGVSYSVCTKNDNLKKGEALMVDFSLRG